MNGFTRPPPIATALLVLALGSEAAGATDGAVAPTVTLPSRPPLVLTLTPAQMQAVLARHQGPAVALMPGAAFDDITVVAPAAEEPMRDPAREVWGGLAAPFWAILHPTQSWRIFLPIPPK